MNLKKQQELRKAIADAKRKEMQKKCTEAEKKQDYDFQEVWEGGCYECPYSHDCSWNP